MALTEIQSKVLLLVVSKLNKGGVSYQVTGGSASILWGVKRETEDLDFDVAKSDINKVREIFRDQVVEDYHHYVGDDFDLFLIICEIDGVQVEFGQAEEAKILGIGNTSWTPLPNTIANARNMEIDGVVIKLQSKEDLIEYKTILNREVDQVDVAALKLLG